MPPSKSISVAMCTYNGERYLQEQLDSIAAQARLPAELVICDDRSTDATLEIAKAFAKTAPFEVRVHLNEVNLGSGAKGITKNFEQAVAMCSGDLIFPCDQDDIWLPQKTTVMAGLLEENAELGGAFSDARLITADGQPKDTLLTQATGLSQRDQQNLKSGEGLAVVLAMDKIYGSSLVFDSRLLKRILPVPPHWWFDAWVGAMASAYGRLAFVAEPMFLYRIHPNQSHSASVATTAKRVKQWRHSAREYWESAEPQLAELQERLAEGAGPEMEPHLRYVRGRMALLKRRSELPASRVRRVLPVMREAANYHRYFNGWKSIVKDLTA